MKKKMKIKKIKEHELNIKINCNAKDVKKDLKQIKKLLNDIDNLINKITLKTLLKTWLICKLKNITERMKG